MQENSPNPYLNESDLLEFALRLATYPNDPSTQNAQLLPGKLPDHLPVDVPFPEGSRVIGSLIRNPESIRGSRNGKSKSAWKWLDFIPIKR
jgi:hypothetical protein